VKPYETCAVCTLKWVYERARVLVGEEKRFELIRKILGVLSQEFLPTINVGSLCNKTINSIYEFVVDSAPYYKGLKLQSNNVAKELLSTARSFIEKGQTDQERFNRACVLAAGTNVAPIGLPSEGFKFQEALDLITEKNPLPTVTGDVFKVAQSASHVLYITDNAGEIGFDSLLIAKLKEMGPKVTLVVKEDPFFEDATTEDVSFFKLDQLADHIQTVKGFFMPKEAAPSLIDCINKSDLLVSKGTGNYEALKGEVDGKKTIYMLKVKCEPIAIETGVILGSFVAKLEK
jgi:uncharacterized protein with ATP-grasp and redox domains